VQSEGDEPGGNCCIDLKAGREAGARRDIPSIGVDLEVAKVSVLWESGTGWGAQPQQ
jgi:hypothetical protein